MNEPFDTFPHQRLDAYHVAVELAADIRRAVAHLPKGRGHLRDQLERASTSTVLLLAEGANRRTKADKNARFVMSRGECAECAAALHLAGATGLVKSTETDRLRGLASRVGAMLTGLIRRLE